LQPTALILDATGTLATSVASVPPPAAPAAPATPEATTAAAATTDTVTPKNDTSQSADAANPGAAPATAPAPAAKSAAAASAPPTAKPATAATASKLAAKSAPASKPTAKAAAKPATTAAVAATKPLASSHVVAGTGINPRLAGILPGSDIRAPGLQFTVPAVIKNFAAGVPDVVGQKYPLLAESKIIPKEPEPDIRSGREDEMTQSFDSMPTTQNPGRVSKAGRSKASEMYEETLEIVNFLNLMTLKIVP
jgi:hypothetical protein